MTRLSILVHFYGLDGSRPDWNLGMRHSSLSIPTFFPPKPESYLVDNFN